MNPTDLLYLLQALNSLLTLAEKTGTNLSRFNAMRAASVDGHLTREQMVELADEAHASVGRLG